MSSCQDPALTPVGVCTLSKLIKVYLELRHNYPIFHAFLCILLLSPLFPCIPLYSPVFSCILLHSLVFPCIPLYPPVFPCIPLYSLVFPFIIWLCLTRTGNYQIHKFDWLKWILTAV